MKLNVCLRCFLAALISAGAAGNALAGGRIIALARGGGPNGMAALDELGALWVLGGDARSFQGARQAGQVPNGLSPNDMTVFPAGGTEYAAVTVAGRLNPPLPSSLQVFDIIRGGKPQMVTLGPGIFTGVVYDPSRKRVLLAEARRLAVFEAGPIPSGSPQVRSLGKDIGAMKAIGALALDSDAQRLYCADPVGGAVYAMDLGTGRYKLVVQQLGEVCALCPDLPHGRLYAGDCARGRVWAIRLNPPAKAEPFATGVKLREPDGLAMDAAGNLWIADAWSGQIHVVAPNGQLLRTVTR